MADGCGGNRDGKGARRADAQQRQGEAAFGEFMEKVLPTTATGDAKRQGEDENRRSADVEGVESRQRALSTDTGESASEDRTKPIADWARDALTFEQLVTIFASQVVENLDLKADLISFKALLLDVMQVAESQRKVLSQLAGETKQAGLKAKLLASIATSEEKMQRFVAAGAAHAQQAAAQAASTRAKTAADARHDMPGGSRDKAAELRSLWATGNYSSRTKCVEAECGDGGLMSIATGIKALKNTPDPNPWPARRPVGRPRKP